MNNLPKKNDVDFLFVLLKTKGDLMFFYHISH